MTKYIPIYEYAKQTGASKQNIYRWVRERKFDEDEVKVEEILVKRIKIKKGAKPKLKK